MGQLFKRADGVELQPHQQGVGHRHSQLVSAELVEGRLEIVPAGLEAPALVLVPDVARVVTQRGLELGKTSPMAEIHLILPAQAVKVHEFVVNLHRLVIRVQGYHPGDIGGYGGRAEAFEHADALVALLHVEAPHVLAAADRVAYSLVAEMRGAELYPLGGEFRVGVQQRHEVGGESIAPPLALGSHDLVGGYVYDAQVYAPGHHLVAEYLVEYLQIRIAPLKDALPIGLLSGLQCLSVLSARFRLAQADASFESNSAPL